MTSTVAHRQKKPTDRARSAASARPSPEAAQPPLQALAGPAERELLEGPTREDLIRRRAFDLYERNGSVDGRDLDDWLTAESEIGQMVIEGTAPSEPTSSP